jgi:hypothetical protein
VKQGQFNKSVVLKDTGGKDLHCGNAAAVTTTDWDNDGDIDLIIGNIQGDLHISRNTGTKSQFKFEPPQKLQAAGGNMKVNGDSGPFVADWDMDGKQDLIVGSGSGTISLFRNTGTDKEPSLAAATALINGRGHSGDHKPGEIGSRTKVCVHDWNEDGKPDLLVGDFYTDQSNSTFHGNVWLLLRKQIGAAKEAAKEAGNGARHETASSLRLGNQTSLYSCLVASWYQTSPQVSPVDAPILQFAEIEFVRSKALVVPADRCRSVHVSTFLYVCGDGKVQSLSMSA